MKGAGRCRYDICAHNGGVFTLQEELIDFYHMCMTFIALQKILTSLSLFLPSLPPLLRSKQDGMTVCEALRRNTNDNDF